MKTYCVGCGCTESMACGAGCYWIEVSGDRSVGICSECWQLYERPESERFATDLQFSADRFRSLLAGIYDAEDASKWFHARLKLLRGKSPTMLVLGGGIVNVRALIEQLRSGSLHMKPQTARHCVFCGDVGPRVPTLLGGWAHRRCIQAQAKRERIGSKASRQANA